jgi:hypothetical protein
MKGPVDPCAVSKRTLLGHRRTRSCLGASHRLSKNITSPTADHGLLYLRTAWPRELACKLSTVLVAVEVVGPIDTHLESLVWTLWTSGVPAERENDFRHQCGAESRPSNSAARRLCRPLLVAFTTQAAAWSILWKRRDNTRGRGFSRGRMSAVATKAEGSLPWRIPWSRVATGCRQ